MLTDALPFLRCPLCAGPLTRHAPAVGCPSGHRFDVARQGYVSLLASTPGRADTPAMVAAREDFLARGHYDALAAALARAAAREVPPAGPVLDVGAGTGFFLAAALDALPGRTGIALDLSKAAARRAARAHPRAAAIVADAWRGIPIASGVVGVALGVLAPRNPGELRRVLRPEGVLLVVTPAREHLRELVGPLGLLEVDADKDARLTAQLEPGFALEAEERVHTRARLTREEVADVVAMGPSAWHGPRAERIARLGAATEVTAAFRLRTYLPRPTSRRGSAHAASPTSTPT